LLVGAGLPREFVSSLTFISVEEFEQLIELKMGGAKWSKLFQQKRSARFANDDMSHVIHSCGLKREAHPHLNQWRDNAFEAMQQFLFSAELS
jgi:hypothetical protein